MQKELIRYSSPCRRVKKTPRATVRPKEKKQVLVTPDFREEWDQVTVAPDERRTTVFSKGTWKADKDCRPRGGQHEPNSTLGESEQCRYAQKKPKKKKISETIKRPIPSRNPNCTRLVWNPKWVDSRIIFDHQKRQDTKIIKTPRVIKVRPRFDQDSTRPQTKNKAEIEETNGQGEGVTKWKGCLVMRVKLKNRGDKETREKNKQRTM